MRWRSLRPFLLLALFASADALAQASSRAAAGGAAQSAVEQLHMRRSVRPSGRANTCATCHALLPDAKLRTPAEQYAGSVHRDPRIGCAGCHQGDAADPTIRAHATAGFVARPTPDAVIGICGGCHGDARFVRQHNPQLQVDQARLYELSLHARLVQSGDRNAPGCADCHGTHAVAKVDAPSAPVHRRNVAKLCAGCHANTERMRPYGRPIDQFAKWARGPHAHAFADGDGAAPTCTGCHGPHAGATAAGATAHVCGSCHEEQLAYLRQSPHSRPFEQLGLSECMPCHDQHEARHEDWLVGITPESACMRCHARDERVRRTADGIGALLRNVRTKSDDARRALSEARRAGLLVSGAGPALDQLRTQELKLRTRIHTFDTNQITLLASAASEAAQRASSLADRARAERRIERRGYYVALALSLTLAGLLTLKVRQLGRRRRRSEA